MHRTAFPMIKFHQGFVYKPPTEMKIRIITDNWQIYGFSNVAIIHSQLINHLVFMLT